MLSIKRAPVSGHRFELAGEKHDESPPQSSRSGSQTSRASG